MMKKPAAILLLLVILFVYASKAFSFSVYTVTKDGINVRIDSTTSSASLGYLVKGETIEGIKSKFEWYKIKLPKRFYCYIAEDFIKKIGTNRIKVIASKVNLRSTPSLESYIIGMAPKDALFYSIDKVDGWIKIRGYPYVYGWVHKKFLKEIDKKSYLVSFVKKAVSGLSEPNILKKQKNHAELIEKGEEIIPLLESYIPSSDKNTSYSLIWILTQLSRENPSIISHFLEKAKNSSLKTASIYLDILQDIINPEGKKRAYFYLQEKGKLKPEDIEKGVALLSSS